MNPRIGTKYIVYSITVNEFIYFGHTNNPNNRITQHIYSCYSNLPKNLAYDKQFYKMVRYIYPNKDNGSIALKRGFNLISGYNSKADAKRKEIYLILERYFSNEPIYQKIPNISDYK